MKGMYENCGHVFPDDPLVRVQVTVEMRARADADADWTLRNCQRNASTMEADRIRSASVLGYVAEEVYALVSGAARTRPGRGNDGREDFPGGTDVKGTWYGRPGTINAAQRKHRRYVIVSVDADMSFGIVHAMIARADVQRRPLLNPDSARAYWIVDPNMAREAADPGVCMICDYKRPRVVPEMPEHVKLDDTGLVAFLKRARKIGWEVPAWIK